MKKRKSIFFFGDFPASPARQPGWLGIIWFALLGLATSAGSAQTTQPPALPSFKELARFGKTLEAIQSSDTRDDKATPISSASSARPTDNVYSRQSAGDTDRIDSIYKRINLLKKLIEDERAAAESMEPPARPVAMEPDIAGPDKNLATTTETPPTESDLTANPDQHPEMLDAGATTTPAVSEPSPGIPVLGEPVNSFELANSLFLTGNIAAARKSYEARLTEEASPEDKAWLKCLVGCCYRLERNFAKSEEIFRDVTSLKQSLYPVDYSKWCLQYVAKRRASHEHLSAIESEIDGIVNQAGNK